jgi:phage antirepressor YoqD-like protein
MIEIRDEYTDVVTEWFTIGETAKALGLKDSEDRVLGRNKLFSLLRQDKILMQNNFFYQQYIVLGIGMMYRVEKDYNHKPYVPLFSHRGINYLKHRYTDLKKKI